MNGSWRVFTWRGVPVTLHWSILLAWLALVGMGYGLVGGLAALPGYLAILLAHELGHAAVARWRGVEVLGIDLYAMHGRCVHEQAYYELDDLLIAWGGVAGQLPLLGLGLLAVWLLHLAPFAIRSVLGPSVGVLVYVNIVTALFNLIPVAPLDGAKAWRIVPYALRAVAPWWRKRWKAAKKQRRLRLAQADARQEAQIELRIAEDAESARKVVDLLQRIKTEKK